jgi:hypothetical protein
MMFLLEYDMGLSPEAEQIGHSSVDFKPPKL